MENLLFYLIKVIICSGVMFLYYQLFLKDKTFHHYNRFYLLSTVVISLVLPILKMEYFTLEVDQRIFLLIENFKNTEILKTESHGKLFITIVLSALGLVSIFFIGKLLLGIVRIQNLKAEYPKTEWDGIQFYQTNLQEAPFSFFRNLFWKDSILLESELGKQILKHEMVHIEQKHSWDKIFLELITAVFWVNPIFFLIKKEIFLIHEYLADHKAVKKSDTKAFAQMILNSHFSTSVLPASSPFLSSNLKKRIKMLQKPNTKYGYARRILALPVVFTIAFAYMVNAKNKEIEKVNLSVENAVESLKILKTDTLRPSKEAVSNNTSEKMDAVILNQNKATTVVVKTNTSGSSETEIKFSDSNEKEIDHNKVKIVRSKDGENDYGIFKIVDSQTRVYDKDGNELPINEKKPAIKTDVLVISTKGADLFVNGKKASDEEFSKFKLNPEDLKNKDLKSNIKLLKIDRVGDANRSYAKKIEIITNQEKEPVYESRKVSITGNSDIKIYLDDRLITDEEMRKIDPNTIERMNVIKNKEDKNRGELRINTKK